MCYKDSLGQNLGLTVKTRRLCEIKCGVLTIEQNKLIQGIPHDSRGDHKDKDKCFK